MFTLSHTTGSMNNVFRAIVSAIVTALTAVIRFTVRLKEILNGALMWMECLQGYSQLPRNGRTVFITSSLKDIMCLAGLGYPSFALQSEMLVPREETISEAKARFKEVIVLYDNDFENSNNPGQTMAKRSVKVWS